MAGWLAAVNKEPECLEYSMIRTKTEKEPKVMYFFPGARLPPFAHSECHGELAIGSYWKLGCVTLLFLSLIESMNYTNINLPF